MSRSQTVTSALVVLTACGDGMIDSQPSDPPMTCADVRSLARGHDAQFGANGIVREWDGTPFRVDMVRNFPEFVTDTDLRQLLAPVGRLADQVEAQLGYRIVEMGGVIDVTVGRPSGLGSEIRSLCAIPSASGARPDSRLLHERR